MNSSDVILVDEDDKILGVMEKMEAYRRGVLHRAFSIFIFNSSSEMLLQQRADQKYHNGGLWTNACCSHPLPGEQTKAAALRRLNEELGFTTNLEKVFDFRYTAVFDNGLTENEFDHVFTGTYDGAINPDVVEVKDFSFRKMSDIRMHLELSPQDFTVWFRIAFPRIENKIK